MHVVAPRDVLTSELAYIKPVTRMLGVGWMRMRVADGQMTLSTHDGHRALSTTFAVTERAPGECHLESAVFAEVVSTLSKASNDLVLQVIGNGLEMSWLDFHARFPLRVSTPPFTFVGDGTRAECSADKLTEAITAASYSADAKSLVGGVTLMGLDGDNILVATTDRNRLTEIIIGQAPASTFVVKDAMLPDIKAALTKGETAVFEFGRHISVTCGGRQCVWATATGTFPKYDRLFPVGAMGLSVEANIDRAQHALRRVALADSNDIAIVLSASQGEMQIASWSGDASESIECTLFSEPFSVSLDRNFLRDVLAAISTDRFSLTAQSAVQPLLFTPAGAPASRFLIMPINRR